MRHVFVTGMFRSGTTLVARMLNTHSRACVASDPMRPLLNSFRTDVAGPDHAPEGGRFGPLADYFQDYVDVLERVLQSDLNVPVGAEPGELLDTVQKRAAGFSGLWAKGLDAPEPGRTYADWVRHFLDRVERVYPAEAGAGLVGFKEVWATEMVPAFLRTFPDSRAVVVVRDPRAVTASKRSRAEMYPLFFLGRQWRKLAFLALRVRSLFPDRVLVLRYEDLAADPERRVSGMCAHLGLDFEDRLLDLGRYTDGWNQPWRRNTSYSGAENAINASSVDKWRSVLEPGETALVELLAHDLMLRMGYVPENEPGSLLALDPEGLPRYEPGMLAQWIRPYSFDQDMERFGSQVRREQERLSRALAGDVSGDEGLALQIA